MSTNFVPARCAAETLETTGGAEKDTPIPATSAMVETMSVFIRLYGVFAILPTVLQKASRIAPCGITSLERDGGVALLLATALQDRRSHSSVRGFTVPKKCWRAVFATFPYFHSLSPLSPVVPLFYRGISLGRGTRLS